MENSNQKQKLPFWKTGVNPITGFPNVNSINRVTMGPKALSIPKLMRNKYCN